MNFFTAKCTIYNRIPESPTSSTIKGYRRLVMDFCNVQGGVQDRPKGYMSHINNAYTVITKDVARYLPPHWDDGGYYLEITNTGTPDYFTATAGDFVVFRGVGDPAPVTATEFSNLKRKYDKVGVEIKEAKAFLYGMATDNITMIKA